MKKLKDNFNIIGFGIFEIVIGVLLLIDPISFTSGIITVGGIVLMALGIISVIKYFRADMKEATTGQYLMKGLILLLAGAFCALKANWFIVTFPVLTMIYGVIVLVTGVGKIQLAVDMIRRKNNKWFLAIISAVISVVCSVVILNDPFVSTTVLWTFTGVTLIVESVIDLVTFIVGLNGKKSEKAED